MGAALDKPDLTGNYLKQAPSDDIFVHTHVRFISTRMSSLQTQENSVSVKLVHETQ